MHRHALPPILPIGTTVVVRVETRDAEGRVSYPRGATGVITIAPADPEHSYRVRMPRGDEVTLKRRDVLTLSEAQLPDDPLVRHDLSSCVVYRCVVGSRAYGLDHAASDTDRRGVYVPPASAHWSLYGVPEQLENSETEECYWEIQKYLSLALKANPNVLETLWTPLVEHVDPIVGELIRERRRLLSKLVYPTFNGYAMSQFKKLDADIRATGEIKWKHAMHLIRLLIAGIGVLRTGELDVRVSESDRAYLLEIRDGRLAFEEINRRRLELHAEFEAAYATTSLPERPDYAWADELLIGVRREMARREVQRGEKSA